MKKILLILAVFLCTSFVQYPCHPGGDVGPCTHPLHFRGDQGPCGHFDYWGNRIHVYDIYPCSHPVHLGGDVYPCTHVCY